MLWHALPPEVNTALLMAGAGPAPMLQAAAGWEALAVALDAQAVELAALLASLTTAWTGSAGERALAAATPTVAWLHASANTARQRGMQAAAQAAAYAKALATTPSLPEIAGNHITRAVLTATNFLGINLVPIGLNETDYFVRMWNQAATVMDAYQAETLANTTFEPITPMKPVLATGTTGVTEAVTAAAGAVRRSGRPDASTDPEATRGESRESAAAESDKEQIADDTMPSIEQAVQYLNQAGTMMAPLQQVMQQMMQQVQQMTSLSSGAGVGDNPVDGYLADDVEQQSLEDSGGLVGASPLSNHPMAGGSGPAIAKGLMFAEALPGAAGTPARTQLTSALLEKPGAGAGRSAVGGAAPMGAMGAGAQSGTGTRSGSEVPVALPAAGDDEPYEHSDDGEDW